MGMYEGKEPLREYVWKLYSGVTIKVCRDGIKIEGLVCSDDKKYLDEAWQKYLEIKR